MKRPVPLSPWLEHFERHLARGDEEGVHQARVALRRLRVWLALSGHHALDDDLRWLLRALAPVRDFDVLASRALPRDFHRWVVAQRAEARRALPALQKSRRLKGLVLALHTLPPFPAHAAAPSLRRFQRELRACDRAWSHGPSSGTQALEHVHALRRALRRLRYARAWLGKKDRGLAALQETLGAVADLGLEQRVAGEFALQGGTWRAADRRRLEAAIGHSLAAARAEWDGRA